MGSFHFGLPTSKSPEECCRKPHACDRLEGCQLLRHPRKRWLTNDPEALCPKTAGVHPVTHEEGDFRCTLLVGHVDFCNLTEDEY